MSKPFRYRRMVEFVDTDMAGIMHFSAFFRFMEGAEHALVREVGLSIFSTVEGPEGKPIEVSFPRVSAHCDYRSPARCEEMLDIEVVVQRLGRTSVTYGFRFLDGDRELATGKITCVCCQMHPENPPKPIELPTDITDRLRPYLVEVS